MNLNQSISPSELLNAEAAQVQTREDFVRFVRHLVSELQRNPKDWANQDLSTYLDALAGWTDDMVGYYQNLGVAAPIQPTWKVLAEMLLAARVYE